MNADFNIPYITWNSAQVNYKKLFCYLEFCTPILLIIKIIKLTYCNLYFLTTYLELHDEGRVMW